MQYLNCDEGVVDSFLDLISIALANYQPHRGPELEDIELLLEAVRVFHPQWVELETFDAMIQARRGLLDDAIKTLKHVVEVRNQFTYGKGLLAYYLFQRDDISWRALAAEVLERNHPESVVKLMHVIEKRDALHRGSLSAEQLIELNRHLPPENDPSASNAMSTDHPTSPPVGEQTQAVDQTKDPDMTQENYLRA